MDTRRRTSLILSCTVQLRTLCATHSLVTLYLFTTSGPDPGELPGFWGSMVFCHAPIPRKGQGKQQQQNQKRVMKLVQNPVCDKNTTTELGCYCELVVDKNTTKLKRITRVALSVELRCQNLSWRKTVTSLSYLVVKHQSMD